MENLPLLPFKQILNHLSLEDRLKSRSVSRAWRDMFDFRLKTLCYSNRPSGFILRKNRWINGVFAQNFICLPQLEPLVNTFGQTILSNLKELRVCDRHFIIRKDGPSLFSTLNAFTHLEELHLFGLQLHVIGSQGREFELNLLELRVIKLVEISGIQKLILDAPRLQEANLVECSDLELEIIHVNSVEKLITWRSKSVEMKKLKNLKYLYCGDSPLGYSRTGSGFLSSLPNLAEIHLSDRNDVSSLFEQRLKYDRPDLKIFLWGCLLNAPNHYLTRYKSHYIHYFQTNFVHLIQKDWILADEIPFCYRLNYIEAIASELTTSIANRLSHLNKLIVPKPVQHIERFLNFLTICEHVGQLQFECDQPQELFDRLPDIGAIQSLVILSGPSDFRFILRLKHLVRLDLDCQVDVEFIRKALGLEFLSWFKFQFNNQRATVEIDHPKKFRVSVDRRHTCVPDLDTAIQFIQNA